MLHTLLFAENTTLEKVTLQLQWKHQFEFAGFYAAKEKGFYKDAGLDVHFVEFDKSKNIVDEVLSKNANYGLSYSSIIAEYFKGTPVVLLANFFKQSPLVLVAQPDIKSPADLKGKKVMGVSNNIDTITLATMLDQFNIKKNDIISIPASFKLDDFINKKVDAMSLFTTNELFYLNQKGIKYTLFDPVAYGINYYDMNLFSSKKEFTAHPQRAKRFRDASIKGWEYALAHQNEIIDLILKKYNSQHKSRKALEFEAKQIEYIMMPKVHKIGSIDIHRIKLITDSFIQAGFIQEGKYHLKDLIVSYVKKTSFDKRKDNTFDIFFSDKEQQYLKNKKNITMCIDPDWMPYEKLKHGKHIGISADYIAHISSKLNIPFTLVQTTTWSESLALFKEGKCDILSLVTPTPERSSFIRFTQPYFTAPLVIATLNDEAYIPNIAELKEKKIGLTKDYAVGELLQYKYLNINFVRVNTVSEGLQKVADGELYGFTDTLATVTYQIQKYYSTKLKISGQLKDEIPLGIGVQKSEKILQDILNKTIDYSSEEMKKNILDHWIASKPQPANANLQGLWKIVLPILLLLLLLLISHYVLRQYNKRLKEQVQLNIEELRKKDELLLQQQRMAAMGEMLSMISHQWKQPLGAVNTAIMGVKIKIESGKFNLSDPFEQKKFLSYLDRKHNSILEYVQYLSNTTDDFRNFFNPNKSKELTALNTPIENVLNIVKLPMKKRGIEISTDLRANTEFMMYPNEVTQILLNLLKNSEDNFREKKTQNPKIIIATLLNKEQPVIRIYDNGGGIPVEIAKHIFEPYFSTKNDKLGTGLGLYMSKMIMEEHHNGTLSMKNQNQDVTFELSFKVPKVSKSR